MSIFGDLNDWLTGNPTGTADAAAAADQTANDYLAQSNANIAASLDPSQSEAFTAQVSADYATDAPAPNTLEATTEIAGAAAEGTLDALGSPGQTFANGLAWVENKIQSFAKTVLGGVLGGIQAWVWVVIVVLIFAFFWVGGKAILASQAKRRLG